MFLCDILWIDPSCIGAVSHSVLLEEKAALAQ
jgi:hypothetical protein